MVHRAFLNGQFVPLEACQVSVADAGFAAGVTVTDFCRTYYGRLFRWPEHVARFQRACAVIGVACEPDSLSAAALSLVDDFHGRSEVAVVSFASPGPLGYLLGRAENGPPTVGMHAFPLPVERYQRFFDEGVVLELVGDLPTGLPPAIKHRSRLHWYLAERAVTVPGAVPVLCDAAGNGDAAIGSVLAVVNGCVVRPPAGTVLDGISAKVVIELCIQISIPTREAVVDLRNFATAGATELLFCGSGFGLAGVRQLVGPIDAPTLTWPGPILRKLQTAWAALVR